jgi:molecular chaperone HscB
MMMDHFERLGLPRRFALDAAALERQYLALSRAAHPDNFQAGGAAAERRASLEMSAALNEAYATLHDPFRRADYLLHLEGGPAAADLKEMPAAFLEEMLELRMEIEGLKDQPDSPAFTTMAQQLGERRDALLKDVGTRLDGIAAAPDRGRLLREARQLLNATKYVQGLLRDLHAD